MIVRRDILKLLTGTAALALSPAQAQNFQSIASGFARDIKNPIAVPALFTNLLPLGSELANEPCNFFYSGSWYKLNSSPTGPGIWTRAAVTPTNLNGAWGAKTQISTTRSKPSLLTDEFGNPQQLGGLYWIYCIYSPSGSAGSQVALLSAATPSATSWTDQGVIIPVNPSLSFQPDGRGILSVSATYYSATATIYLYGMGLPGINNVDATDPTYGFASRICLYTQTTPLGAVTRHGVVANPNTNNTKLNYGYLGAFRALLRPGGGWLALVTIGDTRPSGSGQEPDSDRVFAMTASAPDGMWSFVSDTPFLNFDNSATGDCRFKNIYRTWLVWDPFNNQWNFEFNTGGFGIESLSSATTPTPYSGAAQWVLDVSDNFNRADSATVGNGWTDSASKFAITSNTLQAAPTGSGGWSITRPAIGLARRTTMTYSPAFDHIVGVCMARIISGDGSTATQYVVNLLGAGIDAANPVEFKKVVAGVETGLGSRRPLNSGHQVQIGHTYRIEMAVRASNATIISASIFDLTTGVTEMDNLQIYDSDVNIQSAGLAGVGAFVDVAAQFNATLATVEHSTV